MPSYAYDVKSELSRIFDDDEECMRAELAALLMIGSAVVEGRRDFSNINAAVVRKVITLIKKLYPDAKTEIAAVRTKKLRKTMRYFVRIFFVGKIENFLKDLQAKEITSRTKYRIAWLRGAFLASGTVNRPESYYRLEIVANTQEIANFIEKIFSRLDFKARVYQRKEVFVVYMKEADSVCDFLGMTGAEAAVERFEVARNIKEVRTQVNRIINVETACMNRAIDAAQKQLADIRFLKSRRVKVRDILKEVMDIRLKHPECSVVELAKKIYLTPAAVFHRFKLIHELVEEIKKSEESCKDEKRRTRKNSLRKSKSKA